MATNTPQSDEPLKLKRYLPLTPEENPDHYKNYQEAFDTIVNESVMFVAVTSPYGAGKTSLINAFKKDHSDDLEFIKTSLATFEDEKTKKDKNKELVSSAKGSVIYE